MMNKAKLIDHTLLKTDSTKEQIDTIINEAKAYQFKSVCVNPTHVQYASEQLKGTDVLVCTVIGFPLGATTTAVKSYETKDAINNGAQEIDMVINIGALKDGRFDKVQNDIEAVVQAANGKTVKVIIETVLLTEKEKIKACQLSEAAGLYLNAIHANKKALGIFTVSDHILRDEATSAEERQTSFTQMMEIALQIAE